MKISDKFVIEDKVSGLSIEIIPGKKLDRLRIWPPGKVSRDFWFDKDGKFDGTGSDIPGEVKK